MFEFLLMILPIVLPTTAELLADPAPGLMRSKAESRNLDCTRLTEEGMRRRYPGRFSESSPRGAYLQRDAVVCKERIMGSGQRPARDEALLSELTPMTAELVAAATALAPELTEQTWLVEAFYPSPSVAAKITFATKVELMGHGKRVSDRVPALAAGDLDVLGRMQPAEAYPLACRRYRDEGAMADDQVLLALVPRDERETLLHAGLCHQGRWRWVR